MLCEQNDLNSYEITYRTVWLLGQVRNSTLRRDELHILVALSSGSRALSPSDLPKVAFPSVW